MMNPYKKITKLEEKIETLKAENEALKKQKKETSKLEREYKLKMKLAGEAQMSYMKLSAELQESKTEYQNLLRKLQNEIKTVEGTYSKAVKQINKEG